MAMSIELLHGDCLNLMQSIPDKSIDMILCDLPFGVTQNKADIVIPFEPLWKQYGRIIKDNGAIVLFGQGVFYVDLVNSNRKLFRYDLVWDKQLVSGFLNAKRMPLRQHEQIAVFYKKPPTYNPQFTQGQPLHTKGSKYKDKPVNNQNYGAFDAADDSRAGSTEKYPTSILSFQKPHFRLLPPCPYTAQGRPYYCGYWQNSRCRNTRRSACRLRYRYRALARGHSPFRQEP